MNEPPGRSNWRLHLLQALALLAVIAITVYIFTLGDEAEKLQSYSYPGIFLLSLLSNATIILPAPGIAITFAMGAVFNPWAVAVTAGAGAALGELTGYLAGFSGSEIVSNNRTYETLKAWTQKYGSWAIMLIAFIPNPVFDLAGIAAGALKMPVLKFLLAVLIGKILKMLIFAYAGAGSMDWITTIFPQLN